MNPRPRLDIVMCGRKVPLGQRTLIMGVVNVTPDSFSDGGRYLHPGRALEHALELVRQGADWIDIGGESTRPGAEPVPAEEELRRVLPVIRALRKNRPGLPISIDTTKSQVAEQALRVGASLINDVSGLRFDARLAEVARRYRAPLVLMHLRGRPPTMQQKPFAHSIWRSILEGLERSLARARNSGVPRSKLIIDPGLGFGKSRRQNFEIIANLHRLRRFHIPVLVGTSRKSFLRAVVAGKSARRRIPGREAGPLWPLTGKISDAAEPSRALAPLEAGDAAAVAASILAGAHIVRVHDVAAVLPAVRVADAILETVH